MTDAPKHAPATAAPISPVAALDALRAAGDPDRAARDAARSRGARPCLGVPAPALAALVADWRGALDLAGRVTLAADLWHSDIHDARLAAAKLLTQARIAEDEGVWRCLGGWLPDLDTRALADPVADALSRRLGTDPARLAEVEGWCAAPHPWTRRAGLRTTLPLARMNFPKPAERAAREQVLLWLAAGCDAPERIVQEALAEWLRDLARHDPARAHDLLLAEGARMSDFLRHEAGRHLRHL